MGKQLPKGFEEALSLKVRGDLVEEEGKEAKNQEVGQQVFGKQGLEVVAQGEERALESEEDEGHDQEVVAVADKGYPGWGREDVQNL